MKIHGIEIEDSDVGILRTMTASYVELNNSINNLQKQLNEIIVKKQAISEKIESLQISELEFIEQLKIKYNKEFDTNELLKIITGSYNESGNLCNS